MEEMQQHYINTLNYAGHGVWDWNTITNEIFFSHQWKKMLGYEPEEIANNLEEWRSRIHPDDFNQCLNELAALFSGQNERYRNEHRMLCKDGTYRWVLDQGSIVEKNVDGIPVRIIGTYTDIDDLRRALEEKNS
ncbi:PAS domain-containing protein [Sulfurospirillum oryzae]|uniref:PAS domain-containing protein n=1 Tax=Sulfurospirillum oryzae TaxID=2976535 RepID=UPI0021E73075|nr:PAS domain-containing protein [Sulfurospirillum oryzae]